MNLAEARSFAHEIVDVLGPACERLAIAGSIRRQKPDNIKDIEIVAISKPMRSVFGAKPQAGELQALVDQLRADGQIMARTDGRGRTAWGQKYRRALWGPRAIPLDLFIVTRETWGAQLTLRTGDADFSHKLVTPRSLGGVMPDALRLHEGLLWRSGQVVPAPDEPDFFRALGLVWIDPPQRNLTTLRRLLEWGADHA